MTDAPRYRLVGYDIGTAPDENGGWVHWTDHKAIVARLTAERDDAIRAKDCFHRMTRAHWEALCAMRNSINEYIPMPNTDSGPLFSPEDGPIYADIAERVVAKIARLTADLVIGTGYLITTTHNGTATKTKRAFVPNARDDRVERN